MIFRPILLFAVFLFSCAFLKAEPFLVENGIPKAVIVISDSPERMQRVAAWEFQTQVEKISGARLPIATKPDPTLLSVFIGSSAENPVTDEGLRDGAYRVVSGENWLALIGDDTDFEPTQPFARSNGDISRAVSAWQEKIGAPYGMPDRGLYKNRFRLPGDTGKPDGAETGPKEMLEAWGFDERGSFNAVTDFLRGLGARWFMPGELGEILPEQKTIPLPDIDKTVEPDFGIRGFNFRFSNAGTDTTLWAMRLGIRNDPKINLAHGMATMTASEKVFEAHPEWFALYGGKRNFKPGSSTSQLCYSDEGLFEETVRYVRDVLDTYDFKTVSVMPPDGYTAICQCDKCDGEDSPDRHERGLLSNHVWEFTNRVAREIAKTHPDAYVLNGGYGYYTLPPDNVEKVEPNVMVCIVGARRPVNKAGSKGTGLVAPEALRKAWLEKTDNPILIFENYPFTARSWYLPSFAPKALTESVNATKGISIGEDIWLSAGRDFATKDIGYNHFGVYLTARMYWGGKEQDGDAIFREYCRLFYGPAENEIREFFTYCEENWAAMETNPEPAEKALSLFSVAGAKVEPDSVYAKRLDLIDDYLKGLRRKVTQLSQKRGVVPKVRLVGEAYDIVIDGKLDDKYWQTCPTASTGRLRELQTGRRPTFDTFFKSGWERNNLYFAIRCNELPGAAPVDAASGNGDAAIWTGDAIEILLSTESHSYYQIAISPDGDIVDIDRADAGRGSLRWNSKAEVATRIEEDHWTVEIRIPITEDENDPFHLVLGRKPKPSLPWYINICRQRVRENGREYSAFSPTGADTFHEPMKFAYFTDGNHREFEVDPDVTDFAQELHKATKTRKAEDFLALLELEGLTDFQKSIALEQAASLQRENPADLIAQIPNEAVRKTATMQRLSGRSGATQLVAEYGAEDFSQWPFWKRGDGYRLRGRAHMTLQDGEKAEADLVEALRWISDPATRESVFLLLGQNRERNLADEDRALEAYQAVIGDGDGIGGATQFSAIQNIARLQSKRGDHAAALATLRQVDIAKLKGTWRESFEKMEKELSQLQ